MNFEKVAENLIEDFNTRVLDDSGDIYILQSTMILQEYFFIMIFMMMTRIFNLMLRMQRNWYLSY